MGLVDTFLPLAIIGLASVGSRLFMFFWSRYQEMRDGKPNPYEQRETLGLPKGAIRSFLALTFSTVAVLTILSGDRFILDADRKLVLGELGVSIAFYFGTKASSPPLA